MNEAQKKLEKAERSGAVEDQEQALRQLEQAKAELEKILRQLREEEQQRKLAQLEARFRDMLEKQIEVYEGTQRLDSVQMADRNRGTEIEAGRLSRKEAEIVIAAERALILLKEDEKAVAFPEAVEQLVSDMQQVTTRLAGADVGELTQGIEEDIIALLEEMVAALEKAQQDLEDQKEQPPQEQQPSEQGEQPLVDALAELKLIRSLQVQVNRRTERYARLVEGEEGQAEQPEMLEALGKLSERQDRIFQATRDVVAGKDK
jgi:hypothetical protein